MFHRFACRENYVLWLLCFVVFAALFQVRLGYIPQKEGVHLDEVLSVIISNNSSYCYNKALEENVVYTGKQIKELALFNKVSIADAFEDVKSLYFDNNDRPHTNLFYSCFRLWFAGITTENLGEIIDHGCKLNLLFFFISFCLMYGLLCRLFQKNALLVPFSLLISFGNTGAISNSLFMRPYQLQETLLIAFTYAFVRCYDAIKTRKNLWNFRNFCKFVPIVGLTLLSGYFAAIYVLMLFGVLLVFCKKTDQKQNTMFINISFLSSILFARLLFCGFFYGFTCGRAGEAYKKFSFNVILQNFCDSCDALFRIIQDHLFNPYIFCTLVFVAAFVFVRFLRSNLDKRVLLIFLSCFIWSAGNIFLAPYKVLRYVMACFPILMLIFPFVIQQIKEKTLQYAAVAIVIFFTAGPWNSSAKVDCLFTGQSRLSEFFTSKPDLPVFIFSKRPWNVAYILNLFSDIQCYEFPRSKEVFSKRLKSSAFLLFSDEYDAKEIQYYIPEGATLIHRGECVSFSVYEIIPYLYNFHY
ncbi:MAG: hypothetical protein LBB21_02020 [Holosporaceae bacterium]|jgi:hypothetical protein|nr:hypothetical protein [Holosporaceae bacterium]